jgi:pimeloyl-ACP methyl ester carboxylesterase
VPQLSRVTAALPRLHHVPLALLTSAVLAACGGGDDDTPTTPQAPASYTVRNVVFSTHTVPSAARPALTPGSPGVTVAAGSKLARQFGSTSVDLNKVRYTRYQLAGQAARQPDAILVAIPGTLAAAHSYLILAETLMQRMLTEQNLLVEVWGVDRRSVQLQDMQGLNLAEQARDPALGVNFLFGDELALPLDPRLTRRAIFHDQTELGFIGNWTPQVHSIDIDAVVEQARSEARNGNVFLGGHSAGTGFTARYAATDFNFSGSGPAQPGYAKLRGLVLLEGAGTSLALTAPSSAQLDAVITAADGGLAQAVTAGTVPAYIAAASINPRTSASTEVTGMQMAFEGTINGTQAVLQVDQGGVPGNNVYARVPGFSARAFPVTAGAAISTFMDDDNTPRTQFYSISMGALGAARADGTVVWIDNNETLPGSAFRNFGPMYTTMTAPLAPWGLEVEPTNTMRFASALFLGETTWSDWYYPSSGLLIGNSAAGGGANLGLDTSPLSLPVAQGGRGRPDIVNQTQARNIDIPVIGFGGSNGLAPVPGAWRAFAEAIAPCAATSCTAGVSRTPAGQSPLAAARTYGGVAGGFEVHISEGYTHVDVLTADDRPDNKVLAPLAAFIARNSVR